MLVIEPTNLPLKWFQVLDHDLHDLIRFFCNAASKDMRNLTIEREVEKWLLRPVREGSQIKPLAKKKWRLIAFKCPSALHESQCLTLQLGITAE